MHFLNMAYRVALAGRLDKYDLCHIHGLYNEAIPVLRALAPGLPIIVTIHSYSMACTLGPTDGDGYHEQPIARVIADQTVLLESVDLLAHVSVADRNKGQRLGVRWSCPEVILHNGVEFPDSEPPDAFDRERSLVFVGGLIPNKRVDLTLDAVALVAGKADVRLHVVGDGPGRRKVEERARAADWCDFHGPMSQEALRALLRRQAVMVVPSLSESFGLVYIEALSEGMAVIGYDQVISEFREILQCDEEEKALLVPFAPGQADPQDLAREMEAILDVYFSPQGQAAIVRLREKAQLYFGWPNAIKSVTDAYESVITNNAGG
jgi:glycosyltransferase involved in cell wall biosynthesis